MDVHGFSDWDRSSSASVTNGAASTVVLDLTLGVLGQILYVGCVHALCCVVMPRLSDLLPCRHKPFRNGHRLQRA